MLNFQLDKQELAELRSAHRRAKNALETSRINLLFLPPYSPNLNLIERFWKI